MADRNPLPTPRNEALTDAEISPTLYNIPTRFVMGKSFTKAPLVSMQEIQGHLTLLHAFAELKSAVEAVATPTILGVSLNEEQRWSWFVGCAVERFDIWCHALRSADATVDTEIIMPPVDVIMVWHTYMLNPRAFVEDSMLRRACGILRLLERQFTECLNGKFSVLLHRPPSQTRINFWLNKTSQPFEYSVDGVDALKQKSVNCPNCRKAVLVDLLNSSGSGYVQESFSFTCPGCNHTPEITKETLAVRKFANDLAGIPAQGLSGSVFTPSSKLERASLIKTIVANIVTIYGNPRWHEVGSPQYVEELSNAIVEWAEFKMSSIGNVMGPLPASHLRSKILSAYFNDKAYSIELIGAVLRQDAFTRKLYDLGWTRSGYFDAEIDALVLQHALARYHAFLDLFCSSSSSSFVPTLDIDLVWHTHQLMPNKYRQDCERYVGRFIDHDDKVEALSLSSAFDTTCRAWKSRFNVNYSHCGCPIPGDNTLLSLFIRKNKTPPVSHLIPYDRHDLLSATHPSDHNAVRIASWVLKDHMRMEQQYEKLKRQKEKRAEKAAKETLELEAQGNGSGLHYPHVYRLGDTLRFPYFYKAFLVALPSAGDDSWFIPTSFGGGHASGSAIGSGGNRGDGRDPDSDDGRDRGGDGGDGSGL